MAPKRTRAAARAAVAGASASGGATAVSQASSSGSGIGDSLAALAARGTTTAKKVNSDIEELLVAQKKVRDDRKRLATEVKNARRRRNRLTKKARLLTTEDLLTVVALREGDRVADLVGGAAADADADAEGGESPSDGGADDAGMHGAESEVVLRDASAREAEQLADAERR